MSHPDFEGFVRELMDDWPDVGDIDGFDLQELGEKHGVLVKETRTVPCGEYCNCAVSAETGEEVECYRLNYQRQESQE